MDFLNGLKFVVKQLIAQPLVAKGDGLVRSPWLWLLVSAILFAASLSTGAKGALESLALVFGVLTLLIACRWLAAVLIRNRSRRKLASASCPSCGQRVGNNAAAEAFTRYAADYRRREAEHSETFGEWPTMDLHCSTCQRLLFFNRRWNGHLYPAWEPGDLDPEDLPAKISMKEFLQTGNLGGIRPGDQADHLLATLGEPDTITGNSRAREVWKYGDVGFHFANDQRHIHLISCDSYGVFHMGGKIQIDPWIFAGCPTLHEVETKLEAAGISFKRGAEEAPVQSLHLASGVKLLIATARDERGWPGCIGLYGFQRAS